MKVQSKKSTVDVEIPWMAILFVIAFTGWVFGHSPIPLVGLAVGIFISELFFKSKDSKPNL